MELKDQAILRTWTPEFFQKGRIHHLERSSDEASYHKMAKLQNSPSKARPPVLPHTCFLLTP